MPTSGEIQKTLQEAGVDIASLSSKIEKGIADGEFTEQEAKEAVLQKYNSILAEKSKQSEQKANEPGYVKGSAMSLAQGATAGLQPYWEGFRATAPGKIISQFIEPPTLRIVRGEGAPTLPSISDFAPEKIQEQYQQAKEEYQQKLGAFEEAHPKMAATMETVGTLGSLVATGGASAPAGAAARTLQLGARARALGVPRAVAQAIRSGAPKAAQSAATFGAVGAAEGLANEGEGLSPTGAAVGAGKGILEGLAFSMLTGGVSNIEMPLLKSAEQMTGVIGKGVRTGIRSVAAGLEGAGVATVASLIGEKRLPTLQEIGVGAASVGAIRGAGGVWQGTRRSIGKLADYTELEKQEMAQRAQQATTGIEQKKTVLVPFENKEIASKIKEETGGKISDDVANVLAEGRQKKLATAVTLQEEQKALGTVERARRAIGKTFRKVEDVLDRYAPVKRTNEEAAYALRQRDRGGETQVRQKKLVDSLETAQKDDNLFVEKLDNYLEAKKNTEMLPKEIERLRAQNTKGQLNEVIETKEIQLQKAENSVRAIEANEPKVLEEAQKHWDYAQEQLDKLYEAGRISEPFYNELKNNKHYVHSEAILDDMADGLSSAEHDILNKQTGLSSAFKRYGAYEGQRGNMIISNLAQGKKVDYFTGTQKSMKEWIKSAEKSGEAIPAKGFENLKEGQYPTGYNPEKQIFVWENGKAKVYDVPKNVAEAYNYVGKEENALMRNLRLSNNLFKLGTTGISSGFAAMNLIRDFQSIMGGSRSARFFQPSYIKRAADLYGPGSDKLTGAQKQLREEIDKRLGTQFSLADTQMDINRDELARVDRMLQAQGQANKPGSFGQKALSLLMKAISIGKAPAEKTFQSGAKALSFLGNWSEKIGRATVFQTELRKQAGSEAVFNRWMRDGNIPKKALDAAGKEMTQVTLDFNRRMHPFIETMNKYAMPYFKPSLLGAERLDKILADPEIAPIAWRWISNIGTLQGLINSETDDKKREKYQSQLNVEMQAKNLTFVDRKGNIRLVPANQEFGPWYKLVSIPSEMLLNRLKDRKQREDIADETIASLKELGTNAIPGGYLFNASNFVPTPIGKMIYEEWTNMDSYSKTPIESSAMLRKEKEDRFSATTPKVYRLMSKYLKVGNMQSSPKVWEHRAKKLGSTFAKEMADAADIVLDVLHVGEDEWGLPKEIEEGAVLGRFFNRDYTAYARNVQKYDEEIKPLEQAYNSIIRSGSTTDEEKMKKAKLYGALRQLETQRAQLIRANQDILSNLRRKGHEEYEKYKSRSDKEQAKREFNKKKEIEIANAAKKYYENQKRISDVTDKMLAIVKKQKKEKGIK